MTTGKGQSGWESHSDDELVQQVAEAASVPKVAEPPRTVEELIKELASAGWQELDTLVSVPEASRRPNLMEWCGAALAAMPFTDQGRARGTEFEEALARIAVPGLGPRSALARMREAGKVWRRYIETVLRDARQSMDEEELADVQPVAEARSLEDLADEIGAELETWLDAPAEYIDVVVLWAIGTWGLPRGCSPVQAGALGGAMYYPYLWITSVDSGAGKSTLLRSLAAIVRRPAPVQRITPSVLFRLIDAKQPTLLIDEAGRFVTGNSDLEGLLDMACYREGTVRLSEKVGTGGGGETFALRAFRSFTAIALGGLGRIAPTLRSRSIRLRMRPARASHPTLMLTDLMVAVTRLRTRIGPHLAAHAGTISEVIARPPAAELPAFLARRGADNWRPLFALAELISGKWPDWCRAACERLGRPRDDDNESQLGDVLDAVQAYQEERTENYRKAEGLRQGGVQVAAPGLFNRKGAEYDPDIPLDFVSSSDLCLWLANSDRAKEFAAATGGPNGRPLTPKAVAGLLLEADVPVDRHRSQSSGERKQIRGFQLAPLERAWAERRPIDTPSEDEH